MCFCMPTPPLCLIVDLLWWLWFLVHRALLSSVRVCACTITLPSLQESAPGWRNHVPALPESCCLGLEHTAPAVSPPLGLHSQRLALPVPYRVPSCPLQSQRLLFCRFWGSQRHIFIVLNQSCEGGSSSGSSHIQRKQGWAPCVPHPQTHCLSVTKLSGP